jgi:hypothetical protein
LPDVRNRPLTLVLCGTGSFCGARAGAASGVGRPVLRASGAWIHLGGIPEMSLFLRTAGCLSNKAPAASQGVEECVTVFAYNF